MAKRLFSTYLDENTFREFLQKYNAPEEGSMSSRFASAIRNSLIQNAGETTPAKVGDFSPKSVLDDTPEPAGITSKPSGDLPVLSDFRELYEYRKRLGLSSAENLNDFLLEVLQYLRSDPLFETN